MEHQLSFPIVAQSFQNSRQAILPTSWIPSQRDEGDELPSGDCEYDTLAVEPKPLGRLVRP